MDRHNNIFYRAPRGTWRKGITNRAYRNVCLITAIRHFAGIPSMRCFRWSPALAMAEGYRRLPKHYCTYKRSMRRRVHKHRPTQLAREITPAQASRRRTEYSVIVHTYLRWSLAWRSLLYGDPSGDVQTAYEVHNIPPEARGRVHLHSAYIHRFRENVPTLSESYFSHYISSVQGFAPSGTLSEDLRGPKVVEYCTRKGVGNEGWHRVIMVQGSDVATGLRKADVSRTLWAIHNV